MAKQPTNNFTPSPKKSIKRHKKNLTKAEKKDFKSYRGQGK
jgi:hypothetical protein